MRHRVHTFKVGRSGAHRRAMLANMASSLFAHGQIQTTLVKAKEARRFVEKLITLGKKGDLHRRRLAIARLRDKGAVKLLFEEIAPSFQDRNGGYTRILKLGVRRGDAAELCILQLVKEQSAPKADGKETAPAAEAPKSEEPKVAESAPEAPTAAEAAAEEPKSEEAKAEEPGSEAAKAE